MTGTDSGADMQALGLLLTRYSIAEFEYRDATRHFRLVMEDSARAPMDEANPPPVAPPRSPPTIPSPSVGRFYASLAHDAYPCRVNKGTILGVIVVGPLRLPVLAAEATTILAALQPDGTGVDYGADLFATDDTP
nr:hypothetical protein [uncultured Gellertiella sp.]